MKKIILSIVAAFCCQFAFAQMTVHDSSAFLDINQIKANIVTGGLNFYNSDDFIDYLYPADSQSQTILSSALWIGGLNPDYAIEKTD